MPQPLPAWQGKARIWGSSRGVDPAALVPGGDLVLHAPAIHGAALPYGVLLDDWLDDSARTEIDQVALRALAAWRERRDADLTVDGACLPWVHEGELFADVFLRELRVLKGLRAAFIHSRPDRAGLLVVDDALAVTLRDVLGEIGISAGAEGPVPPAPAYPITFARSIRSRRGFADAREALGVPARLRGTVLVKPFWHLTPLWAPLLERGPVPVMDPFDRPRLPPRELAAVAARGGWIGHPGRLSRRRSRAAVTDVLRAPQDPAGDLAERFLDTRARALLAQLAHDTPATVKTLRRAFSGGLAGAVTPSDGTPAGRAVEIAAREADAPTLHVQHGFFSDLWRIDGRLAPFIDGLEASKAAVWSESQARALNGQARGEVITTGNPGAIAIPTARTVAGGHAVLMPQPSGVMTATVDVRSPLRHLRDALTAMERADGPATVVVRPHPLDGTDYAPAFTEFPSLALAIDRSRPIAEVLAGAALCVGPLSTATLQAAAAGVPSAFLRSVEARLPWPFDGSGAFPTAEDAVGLAELIPELTGSREPPGREAAREALGMRPDALERVLGLV
jgi:hypothetical protein